MSARKTIACPKCLREVAVVGSGRAATIARHNAPGRFGWHSYVSNQRCEGSGALAEPVLLAILEREAEHARQREAEAEARLKQAEAEAAEARAKVARIAKRIEALRAKEIELGAQIAQLEAQEPQR